jgi:hypothetical protein
VKEYYCQNNTAASEEMECGQGEACSQGACAAIPCRDSDNGKNLTVAGTASDALKNYSDACSGEQVIEYYCEDGQVKSAQSACQAGYACKAGRCEKAVCSDSDSGKDQFVQGTATLGNRSNTDTCYSASSVLEYYCANESGIGSMTIACGSGDECSNGACKAANCTKKVEELDDTDSRALIYAYGSTDTVWLAERDVVELNNNLLLEMYSEGGDSATFRLYDGIGDYRDGDYLCSFSLDNGTSDNDFCDKSVTTVRLVSVGDGMAAIRANKLNAVEFFSQAGTVENWTDNPACEDDVYDFDSFSAEFFPYIDTNSSGLDLYNKKFSLFDVNATIKEVGGSSVKLYFAGETHTIEDGDTIQYLDKDYRVTLDFSGLGLKKIEIEPD